VERRPGIARIISVQSFKGGTGKSTITANLAVTLAQLGKRVGVIDLDLEGPGLHVIFGVSDNDVTATINDVLQRNVPISQAVLDLSHRMRLRDGCLLFCPAGHKLDEILKILTQDFNLSTFKKVVEDFGQIYRLDYIFIDSHPGVERDTLLAMALCDNLVLISRVDQQDLFGSGVMTEVAGQLKKPVVLILNMVPNSVNERESKKITTRLAQLFGLDVLTALPFNSDVLESLSKGVFVLERPKDPLTKRFTEIAEKMLEAIESGSHEDYSSSGPTSQSLT
jgi:MinD-like ATPase involved in chromosome partitioning or flagellar assembly